MGRSRHCATYGELFKHHLEEVLGRGGRWWQMLDLAKLYETKDRGLRQTAVEDWVRQTAAFTCGVCGNVFTPLKADEDDEVICAFCSDEDD